MLDLTQFNKTLTEYGFEITGNIMQDFQQVLLSSQIEEIFDKLHKNGALYQLLPEFLPCVNLEQNTQHHSYTVNTHILKAVQNIASDKELNSADKQTLLWSALLHDLGKPVALNKNIKKGSYHFTHHASFSAKLAPKILHRFGFKPSQISDITKIVKNHEFFRYLTIYNMKEFGNRMSTKYVFDKIRQVGTHNFKLMIRLYQADFMSQSEYNREKKQLIHKCATDLYKYYLSQQKTIS